MLRYVTFGLCLFLCRVGLGQDSDALQSEAQSSRVDFNRQIRPILNKHCTTCHGGVKQAADVSFIYRQQTLDAGIIVPGQPDDSELIARVISDDPDVRMPPPKDHPEPLSSQDVELLRRWIAQGAEWGEHWSLQPPIDSFEQAKQNSDWPRQPLDHFVLRRLIVEGLQPAAEAAPSEWLRRVSFDLTGLPPTVEELDSFQLALAASPNDREAVYEGVVDRLLASEHYGERWTATWMDLARYADTMGFEKDPHRDMWPYRDWLIRAFNDDMPFDQFTLKQLAGDLIEGATTDDLIATAFHRNTQTNTEGGTDDEEFRTLAVIDRINTTWTVWQATTFGCVQCHSHPYDAFRQQEYYQFMAFFNNTEDHDLDDDFPTVRVAATADERDKLSGLLSRRRELRDAINDAGRHLADQTEWRRVTPQHATSTHGTLAIHDGEVRAAGGTFAPGCRYTVESAAVDCTAIRVEILPESDDPTKWPEVGSVLSHLALESVAADGSVKPVRFTHVYADYEAGPYDSRQSLDDDAAGFGGYPKLDGPRWAVFVLKEPLHVEADDRFRFSLLQSAQTTGSRAVHIRRLRLWHDGNPQWIQLGRDATLEAMRAELKQVEQQLAATSGAVLPIMQERQRRATRPTRVFMRGNWLDRGEEIRPGVPSVLPQISHPNPSRLELAQWLTSDDNPLTARVIVNRLWAALFGVGIVETLEDFGSTGTPPSHPDLLDHLAVRLQQHHRWHIKPLLKDLVLSSTYRQSHRVTPELHERDPRNRLLARGPRTRLSAEMIRDQALLVSGLMTKTIGGPSVMPPQPEGVWRTVYNNAQWKTAEGPDRYRRGIYTYWRRTSPYPSFLMFDAPSREICSARRVATNTPLQALVTLNDPVYVECSAALAERARRTTDDASPPAAIRWLYRAVTQREPSEATQQQLVRLYQQTLDERQATDAEPFVAAADSAADSAADDAQPGDSNSTSAPHAALTVVANTVFNLDLALTK